MHCFWVVKRQVTKCNVNAGSWIFLVLSPLLFLAIGVGIAFYVAKTLPPALLAVVRAVSAVGQAFAKHALEALCFCVYSSDKMPNAALKAACIAGVLTVCAAAHFRSHYVARDNGQTVATSTLVTAQRGLCLSRLAASMH